MIDHTINKLKARFGWKNQNDIAKALDVDPSGISARKKRGTLLAAIKIWAAEHGHDISDILNEATGTTNDALIKPPRPPTPPGKPPPEPVVEASRGGPEPFLSSHQILVTYFKQPELAERINRAVLRLEQTAPESLETVLTFLECLQRDAEAKARKRGGNVGKTRAGGE